MNNLFFYCTCGNTILSMLLLPMMTINNNSGNIINNILICPHLYKYLQSDWNRNPDVCLCPVYIQGVCILGYTGRLYTWIYLFFGTPFTTIYSVCTYLDIHCVCIYRFLYTRIYRVFIYLDIQGVYILEYARSLYSTTWCLYTRI